MIDLLGSVLGGHAQTGEQTVAILDLNVSFAPNSVARVANLPSRKRTCHPCAG